MRIAQSNSAGIVIGSPQVHFTWYYEPDFSEKTFVLDGKHISEIAERISQATWGKLGVVREELPSHAAGFWGLSSGKRPDAIAWWFSAERL